MQFPGGPGLDGRHAALELQTWVWVGLELSRFWLLGRDGTRLWSSRVCMGPELVPAGLDGWNAALELLARLMDSVSGAQYNRQSSHTLSLTVPISPKRESGSLRFGIVSSKVRTLLGCWPDTDTRYHCLVGTETSTAYEHACAGSTFRHHDLIT